MKKHDFVPSMNQAQMMKQVSKESELTYQQIDEICSAKKQTALKIQLPSKILRKYFPDNYSKEQMEEVLYKLLEKWSHATYDLNTGTNIGKANYCTDGIYIIGKMVFRPEVRI